MRDVLIAGIGSTTFGKHPDSEIQALAVRAANAAILESGLDRGEIEALYLGNFVSGPLTGQEVLAGLVADGLGLGQIPCTKVEGACASGGIAFRHAYLAVASGLCDAALAVGVEKMTHADTATTTAALNCAMDNRSDGVSGLTFPGLFGLAWHIHAERYGTTREQVSAVVTKNKANGLLNPLAQMGATIGADQIAQSPLICDPLRLFDCCPTSDGAAAVLLVAGDRRGAIAAPPVRVRASAQTRGSARIAGHADLCTFDATVAAAQEAYRQAGLTASDVDFVELHDCFSVAEILDSEDLGLIPRGHGAAYAAEGRTRVGGDRPINPSGGLLSKGHPVGATGIGQIYESVLQLRGTHPNQVRDARIGLTHNLGGTGVACTVNILERLDA
ncbi:thiolase C-terminal domain-containing protein [Enterovirga sp. CN4-39]|uniref:thiolase C-terminal domain-containing protein n=1 Tax=Enterovirga sp. CN4-39 TaxID=3400910 RepID=UPI003C0C6048